MSTNEERQPYSVNESGEHTAETAHTAHSSDAENVETEPDVITDPAHSDALGADWSDEGGATTGGPATAVEDEPHQHERASERERERGGLPGITLDPPD